jgi:phosphoglycolate phosphatase-like HAD superfamily hydrolase
MDWDGTISLLRGGWVELMVEMCLGHAPALERAQVHGEMLALNGKPSIHQMARIAELVGRGHADEYQSDYVARITEVVRTRVDALRTGSSPEDLTVRGAAALLDALSARGVELTLISGTPHPELVPETVLLRVAKFFGGRVHGPKDTGDRDFSKRSTIHTLVESHAISGDELVAIGDGPVEITETKALGGLAIAVASDEIEPGSGRFDDFKRRQLLDCGADIVVPDFRDAAALVSLMMIGPQPQE